MRRQRGAERRKSMPETHSRMTERGRAIWLTERLWEQARDLPHQKVAISQIKEFDQDCWFGPESPPTCREIAKHAQRIAEADLNFPIILSANGGLMDGGHRICKAWMLGHTEILAVRFVTDPELEQVV
jgi:hypothetical protein